MEKKGKKKKWRVSGQANQTESEGVGSPYLLNIAPITSTFDYFSRLLKQREKMGAVFSNQKVRNYPEGWKDFFEDLATIRRQEGCWVRGLVIDTIQEHYPKVRGMVMTHSMTEDISSRPSREEVVNLITNYTPLSKEIVNDCLF